MVWVDQDPLRTENNLLVVMKVCCCHRAGLYVWPPCYTACETRARACCMCELILIQSAGHLHLTWKYNATMRSCQIFRLIGSVVQWPRQGESHFRTGRCVADNCLFLYKYSKNVDIHIQSYKYTYAYSTSMIIFERLNRFDLEIYEVGHQDCLAIYRFSLKE
jgi:hypothetical protein